MDIEYQIPYSINQVTPTKQGNFFLATATKITKFKKRLQVPFANSTFQTIKNNPIIVPNSALLCIDGQSGKIKYEISLQKKGYFGVWGYDNQGNMVIVAYTTEDLEKKYMFI